MNTITTTQAAEFLQAHDSYLILTHVRPDGDTIGCAAGLCRALRQIGKTAYILENPEVTELFSCYLEGLTTGKEFVSETVVSVDIAARSLFPDPAKPLHVVRESLQIVAVDGGRHLHPPVPELR